MAKKTTKKKTTRKAVSNSVIVRSMQQDVADVVNKKKAGFVLTAFVAKDGMLLSRYSNDVGHKFIHAIIENLVEMIHPEMGSVIEALKEVQQLVHKHKK